MTASANPAAGELEREPGPPAREVVPPGRPVDDPDGKPSRASQIPRTSPVGPADDQDGIFAIASRGHSSQARAPENVSAAAPLERLKVERREFP
jgi:hypothetical protein